MPLWHMWVKSLTTVAVKTSLDLNPHSLRVLDNARPCILTPTSIQVVICEERSWLYCTFLLENLWLPNIVVTIIGTENALGPPCPGIEPRL